jgi:hypothetical protein
MSRSVMLALAVTLVGLAACDDGYGNAGNVESEETTTTTTAPTTTTTAVPPAPQPSGPEAATVFVDAWINGDLATAQAVAVPAAIDAVWATPPTSTQNRGCSEPPPGAPIRCVYRTDVGELIVQATDTGVSGWYVSFASLSPAE